MSKKEVQDIIRSLDSYEYEDIAIALMAIEHNEEKLPLGQELYDKYKSVYNYYFKNRDDLTGMLNEVLQNPDEIHEEYIEKNIRM
jgi:hypothetical protein